MATAGRRGGGGILTLLVLIEEHPNELSYDWRARFGLPLAAVFDGRMSWGEAYRLVRVLLGDPTSATAAAIAGWDHPWTREAFILADLYDLTRAAATNPKQRGQVRPYPRPNRRAQNRAGDRSARPTVDQATIRAALAASGPRR